MLIRSNLFFGIFGQVLYLIFDLFYLQYFSILVILVEFFLFLVPFLNFLFYQIYVRLSNVFPELIVSLFSFIELNHIIGHFRRLQPRLNVFHVGNSLELITIAKVLHLDSQQVPYPAPYDLNAASDKREQGGVSEVGRNGGREGERPRETH
jgi:hypothetical protein